MLYVNVTCWDIWYMFLADISYGPDMDNWTCDTCEVLWSCLEKTCPSSCLKRLFAAGYTTRWEVGLLWVSHHWAAAMRKNTGSWEAPKGVARRRNQSIQKGSYTLRFLVSLSKFLWQNRKQTQLNWQMPSQGQSSFTNMRALWPCTHLYNSGTAKPCANNRT